MIVVKLGYFKAWKQLNNFFSGQIIHLGNFHYFKANSFISTTITKLPYILLILLKNSIFHLNPE